jgi:pimeloyl-ACP methyl ester carboxylesterase
MGARALPRLLHPLLRAVGGWQRGWWLLKRFGPDRLARIMGAPAGWDTGHDDVFLAVREALFPIAPKRFGLVFDACVSEPASHSFPLEDVAIPTLLVHAEDDPLAPYRSVPAAAVRIPDAQVVTIAQGGHLFLAHQSEVRAAVRAFVERVVTVPALASQRGDR